METGIGKTENIFHKQLSALDLSTIDVQHNPEFDAAIALLESHEPCIFITGEAGTGKSTLLKYFVANTSKQVVVVAPTGVAALNIGGQTIHSFFRFPPGPINQIEKIPHKGQILKMLDTIIIDEISMVRADLMDAIDQFLRLNLDEPNKPFGGIQVVFFGDLFQLPPVVREYEEGEFFSQYYRSPYFFDAHVFDHIDIKLIKLQAVYRQSDPLFIETLKHIRVNRIEAAHLQLLNCRVSPNFESASSDGYITLTTTNKRADEKNQRELKRLPAPEVIYQAIVEGEFAERQYPTDYQLKLRKGAQVMFLNNDPERRWVNGTRGVVEDLGNGVLCVRIPTEPGQPDRLCDVIPHTWKVVRYQINHNFGVLETQEIGTFTQFPLRLAWAITIHKSQGKTLEKAVIDFSGGTFAHGQAYVALSRCTSLDGMILKSPLRSTDIIVDPRVFRFINRLSNQTWRSN